MARTALDRYSVIIISSSWNTSIARSKDGAFLKELEDTVDTLQSQGKKVMLMGRIPLLPGVDRSCEQKRLKLDWLHCTTEFDNAFRRVERINKDIRDIASKTGASYVDFTKYLCPNEICSSHLQGEIVYLDTSHLTGSGSELLGHVAITDKEIRSTLQTLTQQ